MNCLECPRASDCHSEVLNDMQIIECIRMELDKNHIGQAKDELDIYMSRLRHRNNEITGR